jgi:hypothetical protein
VNHRANPVVIDQEGVEEANREHLAEEGGDDPEAIFAIHRPPNGRPDELNEDERPEDALGDREQGAKPGPTNRLVVPNDVIEDG